MPKRTDAELAGDIRDAIGKIQIYTARLGYEAFLKNTMVQDAVVRNIEIIGEAAKNLSPDFRKEHKAIKWQDIAGMRDRLIHQYAGVNWAIVWNVIAEKLPELKTQLTPSPKSGGK